MDARINVNVYGVLGLDEGEAHVIRNAGGVITDHAIRSLAISRRLLGTHEIILIHHTDCGMLTFTDDGVKRSIQDDTGIKPGWAAEAFATWRPTSASRSPGSRRTRSSRRRAPCAVSCSTSRPESSTRWSEPGAERTSIGTGPAPGRRVPGRSVSPSSGGPLAEHRPSTSYASATAHYLSEDRRDAVKRHWEEPATRGMIAAVLGALGHDGGLRVLDVGAGTGDALRLLRETVGTATVDYLGIDTDQDMVATASQLHRGQPGVAFVRHDVREPLEAGPFDLVLSTGVPFSHLRHDELRTALAALFAGVPTGHRCAAVVDVLGRWSLEWTPNWDRTTWRYAMSFFAGTDDVPRSEMTFHSRESLWSAVTDAAASAGARVRTAAFHDRSVAVGRHTATAEFDKHVPPYRTLVNRLYAGDTALDIGELTMRTPDGPAPDDVRRFFERFAGAWNDRVADAGVIERALGATAESRTCLARSLRALEHGMQSGLGTAHSLSALLVVER